MELGVFEGVGVLEGVGVPVVFVPPPDIALGVGLGVVWGKVSFVVGVGDGVGVEKVESVEVGDPGVLVLDTSRTFVGVGELFMPPPTMVAVGTGLSRRAIAGPSPPSRNASPIILNFSDRMLPSSKSTP